MSTGDLDNRLGDADDLAALIAENPDLRAYLEIAWNLAPVTTFFIPYGAGISADGKRVYRSYDIQTQIQGINCDSALVRHETTEWGLRHFLGIGEDYISDPTGHRFANRAEHDLVNQLLNREDGWDVYSEIIDPQITNSEREEFEDYPVPRDLAMYPYDEDLQARLREAMLNDRSEEEWRKINGQR